MMYTESMFFIISIQEQSIRKKRHKLNKSCLIIFCVHRCTHAKIVIYSLTYKFFSKGYLDRAVGKRVTLIRSSIATETLPNINNFETKWVILRIFITAYINIIVV